MSRCIGRLRNRIGGCPGAGEGTGVDVLALEDQPLICSSARQGHDSGTARVIAR